KVTLDIAHLCIKHLRAFVSGQDEQLQNGVTVQVCQALSRSDRAPFNQTRKSAQGVTLRRLHVAKGNAGFSVRKGCGAGRTAISLHSALAVGSEFIDCGVLAVDACHGVSSLVFFGETSHNHFGSRAWVTPRFVYAPQTA